MSFNFLEGIHSIAVVGATGLVGREFLEILAEHKLKIPKVLLFASEDSRGEMVEALGSELSVSVLSEGCFDGVEVAFFSVPADITIKWAPIAEKAGCLVVDDSSVFRMDKTVPLVIPEVNGASLRNFEGKLVATPNCSTTPIAMVLKPLQDSYGLKRVVVTTLQSVSGAGKEAFNELSEQTVNLMNGQEFDVKVFAHRIAFNCLPLIGEVDENGDSSEELKIARELRKILSEPKLEVSATTVRVPTFCGHGASVNVELGSVFNSVEEVRELLDGFKGLKVLDMPAGHIYPTNIEATGSDEVYVGRIRQDHSRANSLNFWVMADNIRKGAALNALQILDTVYKYRRMV